MILFWTERAGSYTIDEYLVQRGASIAERFRVRHYEEIGAKTDLECGTHVFASLDQLSDAGLEMVSRAADQLLAAGSGMQLLNHPRAVLFRRELLRRAWDDGINQFRAVPVRPFPRQLHYPVFLRSANHHDGSLTGLLSSESELRRAIRAQRLRGRPVDDLLAVELCDTSTGDGTWRKYAAFRVGGRIVPVHLMISTEWMVKFSAEAPSLESALEELRFVQSNPHEAWLRRVTDIAGVTYGRVDYGVKDGVPQLWEINTNPTIGRRLHSQGREYASAIAAVLEERRTLVHQALRDAFLAIDSPAECAVVGRSGAGRSTVTIEIPSRLVLRLQHEREGAARRRRVFRWSQWLYERPVLGMPLRTFLRRITP